MTERQGPGDAGSATDDGGNNGGPVRPGAEPRHRPGNGNGGPGGGPGTGVARTGGAGESAPVRRSGPGPRGAGGEPGSVIAREPDKGTKVPAIRGSRASGLWIGLILSAIVLLFLLIFIVQNNAPTEIRFLGASGTLPVGVALLFAAALGILLVGIPGGVRILQLRRQARKRELS
jgi:uncharacterized integral membrane protein